jgi:16S rRNA (cytosine967-C5)-methyltransferase
VTDPRAVAVEVLVAVERGVAFAKPLLDTALAGVADARDRGLATEVTYGALRRRRTIDACLAAFSRTALPRLSPLVRAALRAGAQQVLFLDRVPAHAAVDAAVGLVAARTNPRFAGYANAVLRNLLRAVERRDVAAGEPEDPTRDVPRPGATSLRFRRALFPDPEADPADNLGVRYAHPTWLVRRWVERRGLAPARAMLEAGASRPPLALRAPPGGRGDLLARLVAAGARARAGEGPDAVVVEDGEVAALGLVREGLASVQDETAQRVAPLLGLRGGERVLDLCAAPGGKARHALDLLAPAGGGDVVACDVTEEKTGALRAALRGRPVRVVLVPEEGPLPFPPASFDAVLLDAPCSNTGVLRRRVEARDRLSERDVPLLAALQRRLLARAMPLVAAGGRLVYATCSVEPEECEDVVASVLRESAGWRAEPGFSSLPTLAHDGGFAAVLTYGVR